MDDKMKAAFEKWYAGRAPNNPDILAEEAAEWTLDYLRSQQGHLDRERFERSPCYLCGYNGEGYYQPDKHPCAARYHAKQPDAGLDVEAVLRQFLTGDGYIAECDIQHIVAALTAQPAAGEEIMVNAAHDVYTLPLQPSGLSSGPRFVVHVPGREAQRAEVDALREALEEIRSRCTMNLAMQPDPFELTAELGNIHQIADAVLSKENSND